MPKIIPIAVFSLLSLIIVFPLLSPGYILTLDKVVTARTTFPVITSTTFLFDAVVWTLNLFISAFLLQKILLLLIFFLSGFSMFTLMPEKLGISRYFAGVFYTLNPFVYERVMAGHWQLLLGYSIFPFIIRLTYDLFHNPSAVKAVFLSLVATILFNIDIHFLLIFPVFFILLLCSYLVLHSQSWKPILKSASVFFFLAVLFNANWIIFSLLGMTSDAVILSEFTRDDLIIFQSVPDNRFGLIFNLLSGYGFWPEVYDYFVSPKSFVFFWPLLSIAIMLISIYGFGQNVKKPQERNLPLIITFAVMFLISLDLAGGVALKPFENVVVALYDRFVPLRGLREPQKLVGIIMMVYAYFGSFGLYYLRERIRKSLKVFVLVFLAIPFLSSLTVFNGFWGQLKPVFYPASWEKVESEFKKDRDDYIVLFFPWHQYLRFNFANKRVVANPAQYFFGKPVLSSQNYETQYLYSHETRPDALHVDGLLSIETGRVNLLGESVDTPVDWAQDLSVINVKYIILAKTSDWENYNFLGRAKDLQKIIEDEDLILYQNLDWGKEIPEENIESDEAFEPPVL